MISTKIGKSKTLNKPTKNKGKSGPALGISERAIVKKKTIDKQVFIIQVD